MSRPTFKRGPHPKKAGKARPPHMESYRNEWDKKGKRHWRATNKPNSEKGGK